MNVTNRMIAATLAACISLVLRWAQSQCCYSYLEIVKNNAKNTKSAGTVKTGGARWARHLQKDC